MQPVEPTLAMLTNPVLRYFLATRPAFLSVTLFAYLIGLAAAYYSGAGPNILSAAATLIFALLAHAGINVLNDYYDALNGTDAGNTERIFPYTGGSRFIQNGVLTAAQTAAFGAALLGLAILGGLWLTKISAPGLLGIGALGLFIGWAYSAPPFALNSRGIGELCVASGFILIALGTDFVQRGSFSPLPLFASVCYGFLVTNLLYINQFPDRQADLAAGKRHWVARLSVEKARWGYLLIGLAAYLWLFGVVVAGWLPGLALIALLPVVFTAKAARDVLRFARQPQRLAPAIRLTIAAACSHGFLLALALVVSRAQAG